MLAVPASLVAMAYVHRSERVAALGLIGAALTPLLLVAGHTDRGALAFFLAARRDPHPSQARMVLICADVAVYVGILTLQLQGHRHALGAAYPDAPAPTLQDLAVRARLAEDAPPHKQRWIFETGVAHGYFQRPVGVESSADGRAWYGAGDGTIFRYARGRPSLEVALNGSRARFWRVTLDNREHTPLAGIRPVLQGVTHVIVFAAPRERSYALQWGNSDVAAAHYDWPTNSPISAGRRRRQRSAKRFRRCRRLCPRCR